MNRPSAKLAAIACALIFASSAALAQNAIAGKTFRSWSPSHGSQIEYMAPGGRSYLWYPGNRVVLPGLRKTGAIQGIPAICFLYGDNTYNPVTAQPGGRWQCRPESLWARTQVEAVAGDVFSLSRRSAAPFPLPRENIPMAQLRQGLTELR